MNMQVVAVVCFSIIGGVLIASQVGWQLGLAAVLFSYVIMPYHP